MAVERRAPRLLIAVLAVPVIAAMYLAVAAGRATAAARTGLATMLGATVIGAVYVDEAWRRTPAPARRAPLPTALATALALTLVGTGLPPAEVRAHSPANAVVDAAMKYLNKPYVWGAEGPNAFDCSGLVYRAFRDAGELALIGGRRRTAKGYFRFFANLGLTSKKDGRRGDLVIYGGGVHMGIYLGNGKVLSAVTSGVKVHGLHALGNSFTTFLNVPWGGVPSTSGSGDSGDSGGSGGSGGGGGSGDAGSSGGSGTSDGGVAEAGRAGGGDTTAGGTSSGGERSEPSDLPKGYAFGSLNMRSGPGPDERIISWLTRGTTFTILETGESPSGALWLRVRKPNGKEGWIWARWTRVTEGSLEDLNG
ncbi:MAG: NlpC/P60 family protein [Chloroflexota bacterium]|nr:NlpC/P60 family protein [Chloroflexota bacterium]